MQVHACFLYQSLKLLNGIPFKAFYYFYIINYQSWTKLPFDWPYIVLKCFVFKVKLPVFSARIICFPCVLVAHWLYIWKCLGYVKVT